VTLTYNLKTYHRSTNRCTHECSANNGSYALPDHRTHHTGAYKKPDPVKSNSHRCSKGEDGAA
jgi:hypothetical protein